MATIATSTTQVLQQFAFTGIGDDSQPRTQIPRQEIFVSESGVLAAPGAGNDRKHTFNIVLPMNFSYALVEASFRLDSAGGTTAWAKESDGVWSDGVSGATRKVFIPIRMNTETTLAEQLPGELQTYTMSKVPNQVLVPQSGTSANLIWRIYDPTLNGSATNYNVYARFLMYDISQAHHWAINTPTLTR